MKSIIKEDTITVISEYTIRTAGIYDRDSTSTDTSVSRYALDIRQPGTLERTRARSYAGAGSSLADHKAAAGTDEASACQSRQKGVISQTWKYRGKQFPEPEESGHT